MRRLLKSSTLDLMARPWFSQLLSRIGGHRCAILMLHRFQRHGSTEEGHDPQALRRLLAGLRQGGVALVDVDDVARGRTDGVELSGSSRISVAFTVDDGYADLMEVAAPIFAEFDCPVTGFVVPDVVARHRWYWWDQIDWILRHAKSPSIPTELGGTPYALEWATALERHSVQRRLGERLKRESPRSLAEFIDQLSQLADVPVPDQAPPEYATLTWEQLRSAERVGVRFGAHSMTHPILSRCDDTQAAHEVIKSVRQVRSNLARPSEVFCYPNGLSGDFGARERALVREAGAQAALTSIPALVRYRGKEPAEMEQVFALPRFAYDERPGGVARMLLG